MAIDREALSRELRDDPVLRRLVVEDHGLYCLAGRVAILAERPNRQRRARKLQKRAQRVARVLRHFPYVRGLVLTGSTSADDATESADIDLLSVVAAGRLATAFVLLGSISRLVGRRIFCPNWYLSDEHLGISPRSPYLVREIAQARSLAGAGSSLRGANPWIPVHFPNVGSGLELDVKLTGSSRVQLVIESWLDGPAGDRIERWAHSVAVDRLRIHYAAHGRSIPCDIAANFARGVALCFHGFGYERTTSEAYANRRIEIEGRLRRLEAEEHALRDSP